MARYNENLAVLFADITDSTRLYSTMGDNAARVVVNAKTGTVVISRNVRVTAAAVTHGTITVSISTTNEVSQPGPFSQGQTAAVQNSTIEVKEPNKPMFLFQPGVDLRQIVDAVNQVGASPSALITMGAPLLRT